ncbi:MAG: polysaccharide deacetylase family protein [Desulfurivibrio sp.]|nr:polysaccharide deacetylase family protein [Desulfurivibrio sp.]
MWYKTLVLSVLLLLWSAVGVSPGLAESSRGDATILIYHHFGDERYPTTNVGMDQFKEQLAYLDEQDYNVIPLAALVEMLATDTPLPPKTVVITVDDAYRSTYEQAWPELKKYDFPFTVFVYVGALEKGYSNYLSWEQVEEMAAAGVDIQDHSYSHHRLADWPAEMDEEEYRSWIRRDLQKGRKILTQRLGEPPPFFAIPYGEYNHIVLAEAAGIGYEAVFTQDAGSVSDDTDLMMITREPILGEDWSTLEHFIKVLERVDLPLADYTPGLEPLAENPPPIIGARLLHPERYRPGTFGIFVSELGWQQATVEGDCVYIENDTELERRTNRVMISAREKESGRLALRYWMLTSP